MPNTECYMYFEIRLEVSVAVHRLLIVYSWLLFLFRSSALLLSMQNIHIPYNLGSVPTIGLFFLPLLLLQAFVARTFSVKRTVDEGVCSLLVS